MKKLLLLASIGWGKAYCQQPTGLLQKNTVTVRGNLAVDSIEFSPGPVDTFLFTDINGVVKKARALSANALQGSYTFGNSEADTTWFFGNSITKGYGLPDTAYRYSSRLASRVGTVEMNRGISGQTMQTYTTLPGFAMVERIYSIPHYRPSISAVFFSFGVNDARLGNPYDTSMFKTAYAKVLDSVIIARGFPPEKVFILTPTYYNDNTPHQRNLDYVNATKSVGAEKGIQVIDVYSALFNSRGLGVLQNDSLHLNSFGTGVMANSIFNFLNESIYKGLKVNHNASFSRGVNLYNLPLASVGDSLLTISDGVVKKGVPMQQWANIVGGINYAGGNVGIGTIAPGAKLDVTGGAIRQWDMGTNRGITMKYDQGLGPVLQANNYSGIGFFSDNIKLFTTTTSGLHFASQRSKIYGGDNDLNSIEMYKESTGEMALLTSTNSPIRFTTSNLERMVISGIGNVGIGVTAPVHKLEVDGSIRATQFRLSALNSAPSSSTDAGELGEIRIANGFIYVCVAANVWQRSALSTW